MIIRIFRKKNVAFRGKIVCDGICGLCVPYVRYDIQEKSHAWPSLSVSRLGLFPAATEFMGGATVLSLAWL